MDSEQLNRERERIRNETDARLGEDWQALPENSQQALKNVIREVSFGQQFQEAYRQELEHELRALYGNDTIRVNDMTDDLFPERRHFNVREGKRPVFAEVYPLHGLVAYTDGTCIHQGRMIGQKITDLDLDEMIELFENKGYDCFDSDGTMLGYLGPKTYVDEALERRKAGEQPEGPF